MSERKLLPGKFVWFELVTGDVAGAQAFYGEVLGWKVQKFPIGGTEYAMIYAGDQMIGGYASGTAARWVAYASVSDVAATVRATVAAGGKALEGPAEIPGVGQRARIADPQGAELGLLHSASGDAPDADAPQGGWIWNELHTPDPAGALAFYAAALGYGHQTLENGGEKYHVIGQGGVDRGGVTHHLPPGVPAHWLPYARTSDPDAALGRAARSGGKVMVPAMDIPGIGRFGVLADPAGATLAVMNPIPTMKK